VRVHLNGLSKECCKCRDEEEEDCRDEGRCRGCLALTDADTALSADDRHGLATIESEVVGACDELLIVAVLQLHPLRLILARCDDRVLPTQNQQRTPDSAILCYTQFASTFCKVLKVVTASPEERGA